MEQQVAPVSATGADEYAPVHKDFIEQRLPSWLTRATARQRAAYFESVRGLAASQREVAAIYAHLQSPEDFARPLLTRELYLATKLELDVDSVVIARVETRTHGLQTHHLGRKSTLLEAALQNYQADEAEPGGLGESALIADAHVLNFPFLELGPNLYLRYWFYSKAALAISPQTFVAICRKLDLGLRYQQHVRTVTRAQSHQLIISNHLASTVLLAAHEQWLSGTIDATVPAALTAACRTPNAQLAWAGQTIAVHSLRLLETWTHDGYPLSGAFALIALDGACIVYLPGAGKPSISQHPSLAQAAAVIREWLRDAQYSKAIKALVAHADQPLFERRLVHTLNPPSLFSSNGEPAEPDLDADIGLRSARQSVTLPGWLLEQAVSRVEADALVWAVPTAAVDRKARDDYQQHLMTIGENLLNLAGLFLPGVGEVMGVVGALGLLEDIFTGIDDWRHGQTEEALGHMISIAENVVLAAATAGTALAIKPSPFVDRMAPITDIPGQSRLWDPDLRPWRTKVRLPAASKGDALGVHHYRGKTFVRLEGFDHQVRKGPDGTWTLAHPRDPRRVGAVLQHNGTGGWRHAHEQVLEWEGTELLSRFGQSVEHFNSIQLRDFMELSGVSDAQLRRAHHQGAPIPALLAQTMDLPLSPDDIAHPVETDLLCRDFPGLPRRLAADIIDNTGDLELERMRGNRRVPLTVAEQAHRSLREWRVISACKSMEGAHLHHPDQARLALALTPSLSHWPANTRLEWRQGSPTGPLLGTAGPAEGRVRYLVQTDKAFNIHDAQLNVMRADVDLFTALSEALPEVSYGGGGERVAGQLAELAIEHRAQVPRMLGLVDDTRVFRRPLRAHFNQVGYALSGRGRGAWHSGPRLRKLYPALSDDALQQLASRLREQHGSLHKAVGALEQEWQVLHGTLETWRKLPSVYLDDGLVERPVHHTSKVTAVQRIGAAWRLESPLHEGVPGTVRNHELRLNGLRVGPLPALAGNFAHVKVLKLNDMQLNTDPSIFLESFTQLRSLTLTSNRLAAVPAIVERLPHLQYMDLGKNALVAHPQMFKALRGHPTLRELLLDHSPMQLPGEAWADLASIPHLERLFMGGTGSTLRAQDLAALATVPNLRVLDLSRNRITLDAEGVAALASMSELRELYLDRNPLRMAPNLAPLQHLQTLNLSGCRLDQWPPGLDVLMDVRPTLQLRRVDLSINDIGDIPPIAHTLFCQRRQGRFGRNHYRLNLSGNPLSERSIENVEMANLSVQVVRRRLPPEGPASIAWMADCPIELRQRIEQSRQTNEARGFYAVLDRVVETADYRTDEPGVRQRMREIARAVLAPEANDPLQGGQALRQQLFDIADDVDRTCGDGITLVLNQMETTLLAWRSAVSTQATGDAFFSPLVLVGERILRLALVDEWAVRIAAARALRRQAMRNGAAEHLLPALDSLDTGLPAGVNEPGDEAEVRLVLRLALAQPLDLPPQPALTRYTEKVSTLTLQRVQQRVKSEATRSLLVSWLVDQPFWLAYLRSHYIEAFQTVEQAWASAGTFLESTLHASGVPQAESVTDSALVALEQSVPQVKWRHAQDPSSLELTDQRYFQAYARLLEEQRLALARLHHNLTVPLVERYSSLPTLVTDT